MRGHWSKTCVARGSPSLLVTHFMEEAERLCDRVAVIDAGRVVAVGSTGHAGRHRSEASSWASFRPSAPFDDHLLLDLPEVGRRHPARRRGVRDRRRRHGERHRLHAGRQAVSWHSQLQVGQPNLEDVFVALTGHERGTADKAPDRGAIDKEEQLQ